jgi:hypothetical protein
MTARVLWLLLVLTARGALATDRPVAGDRLTLKDPADPSRRSVRFQAAHDPAIDPGGAADPRTAGATLEVTGANPGDGAAGPILLAAGLWTGLGNPSGANGYKWRDPSRATGVKTVVFKRGVGGGTLSVSGGGSAWPYAVGQAQGPIALRFALGADMYCARVSTFTKNQPGAVVGRDAPAPPDCSATPPPACGDGTAGGSEECDDGNVADGDGCSATCQLESTAALCAGVPTVPGTGLDAVRVAGGLTRPLHVTAPPLDPNRLFIVEQNGRILVRKNNAVLPTPFLDIGGLVSCCGERGLLSLAFHPDYEANGRFFVNYTNGAGDTVVARYQVSGDPDVAAAGSGVVILTVAQDFLNHNGGQLAFGPDGYLYIGMGDGGSGDDPNERAEDDGQLLGKMLRIDVNAATYVVPPSNPFAGPGNPLDEIWAKGLRNPWRFSFDRGTGDLYIADVGQSAREEVDVQPAASAGGENYGWDIFEGALCHEPTPPATLCPGPPTGYTFPVLEYDHGQGCSITGGFVYRGCRMPDLRGTYFYSDFCTAFVRTFTGVAGGAAQNLQDRTADVAPGGALSIGGVSSFGEDARGEVYVVDYGGGTAGQGEVYQLVPGS